MVHVRTTSTIYKRSLVNMNFIDQKHVLYMDLYTHAFSFACESISGMPSFDTTTHLNADPAQRAELLLHPPYSDIAPSDYHLFRSLQNSLNGKNFFLNHRSPEKPYLEIL